MNGHKHLYAASLSDPALAGLLDVADVVIEASRPRALEQAGLDAATRAPRSGRVWVRITGYGTADGLGNRVAFGDDAAVAGGLVGRGAGGPVFCGDAIADPLTGLEAASAVLESLDRGGGEVIDVAMAGVAAEYAAVPTLEVADRPNLEVAAPRKPQIDPPTGTIVGGEQVTEITERRRTLC
jgi:crotonobetainyl-CoA:carnitine CoA-transferase CaiB-like acyl-CoA transferase